MVVGGRVGSARGKVLLGTMVDLLACAGRRTGGLPLILLQGMLHGCTSEESVQVYVARGTTLRKPGACYMNDSHE